MWKTPDQLMQEWGLEPNTAYRASLLWYWLTYYYGVPFEVTSGARSYEQQSALYAQRGNNPYPVAAPGTSQHERRTAFDARFPSEADALVAFLSPYAGLVWGGTFKRPDRIHFQLP